MDMAIPKYLSAAGQYYPVGSLGKDDTRQRVESTTAEECKEYAALLEEKGFTLVQAREIPSAIKQGAVNLFYEYENGETRVFLFWDASIATAFLTTEAFRKLPKREVGLACAQVTKPTLTQLAITLGMCYIVQLKNGEFILVDSGDDYEADRRRLYDFLKEKTGGEKPVVALWLFTHPHHDHIDMAAGFLEEYVGRVTVKAFAYQFPALEKLTITMEDVPTAIGKIERLERNIQAFYPTAAVYSLHAGQTYSYDGVEIEILCTVGNTYPTVYTTLNDMSAAFRLRFESGKTALFLGDCMLQHCRRLAHTYGEYVKSDILQVTHHGIVGGDKYLYEFIDPELCFWPTSEQLFLGEYPRHRYKYCLGEGGCDYNAYLRDESIRKRTHYHGSKTVTIEI